MSERIIRSVGLLLVVCMIIASFSTTFAFEPVESECDRMHDNADVSRLIADNWCDGFVGEIIITIGDPYMWIDGVTYLVDPVNGILPRVSNDEVFTPVSTLVEATGGTVEVDLTTESITIEYDRVYELTADEYTVYIDDVKRYVDVAPMIIDDTIMLSICTLESEFGFEVYWDLNTE